MSAQPFIDMMWFNSLLGFCFSFVLGLGTTVMSLKQKDIKFKLGNSLRRSKRFH